MVVFTSSKTYVTASTSKFCNIRWRGGLILESEEYELVEVQIVKMMTRMVLNWSNSNIAQTLVITAQTSRVGVEAIDACIVT